MRRRCVKRKRVLQENAALLLVVILNVFVLAVTLVSVPQAQVQRDRIFFEVINQGIDRSLGIPVVRDGSQDQSQSQPIIVSRAVRWVTGEEIAQEQESQHQLTKTPHLAASSGNSRPTTRSGTILIGL